MTDMKEKFSSLLNQAQELGKSAVETAKATAEKGKEAVEEHIREREANEIYRKLGKKVFKLATRGELQLPSECDKYLEALNELYDEGDKDDSSAEIPACKDGETCDKADDKADKPADAESKADDKADDTKED